MNTQSPKNNLVSLNGVNPAEYSICLFVHMVQITIKDKLHIIETLQSDKLHHNSISVWSKFSYSFGKNAVGFIVEKSSKSHQIFYKKFRYTIISPKLEISKVALLNIIFLANFLMKKFTDNVPKLENLLIKILYKLRFQGNATLEISNPFKYLLFSSCIQGFWSYFYIFD